MLRKLLIGFGIVEIVKPEPVIRMCERIGLRNPEATQRRPLALTGARLEGLAFVWLLARGRTGSTLISGLLGLAGMVLVMVPQPVITVSQHLVYANTDDLELQPWVVPAARLLGVLYLTVTLLSRDTDRDVVDVENAESDDDASDGDTTAGRRLRLPTR
ncbi:hypothetical protein [Natrinema halophilum]|uniref:Uncharacterized protein n=1 Tax=Natrinema halophilum TaxID=1699371 RepID=A0A7D5GNX0_9EURY|nr:hypothetical protein [Natrinema halophilum]QLG49753.1 hypothetical protein HYG82_13230 [Natrinema halophilum]